MTQPTPLASHLWNAPAVRVVPPQAPAPRPRPPVRGDGEVEHRGFRGDIEGLRAIAVLSVLLWHGGLTALPGGFVGVDVFFVISGFLITRLIVTEIEQTGRLSLIGFYGRRAKRLLPGAAVVLATTLVLSYLFLPKTRWAETGWDVVSSGIYAVNWRLAERSVDYLASDQAPSAVQHFWSLAVEEQFYLAWPPLLLLAAALIRRSRRAGRSIRGPLLVCMLLIAVPSLTWSIYLSSSDPGRAYFHSTTRAWELAIGAGLAIVAASLGRMPRALAVVLGWSGMGAVLASFVVIDRSMPFPGYVALLPTLGAAAVIAAGPAAGRGGPVMLLGLSPMRAVGSLSYSLYLWHWPLLVVARAALGDLSVAQSLTVVAFSFLPAYLTYRFVENPFRYAQAVQYSPTRAIQLGMLCTAIPVIAGLLFQFTVWPPRGASRPVPSVIADAGLAKSADPAAPRMGAAVLASSPGGDRKGAPVDRPGQFVPDALAARNDLPDLYRQGCQASGTDTEPRSCTYGNQSASFTIALVGDSHAAQWAPALQAIATAKGWQLVTYTKSACPFLSAEVANGDRPYTSCTSWNRTLLARLTGDQRPNLVVTSSSNYRAVRGDRVLDSEESRSALGEGMHTTWKALGSAGVKTVVLRDTPRPDIDIAECASQYPNRMTKCAVDRDEALSGIGERQVAAAASLRNVTLVDLNDAICPTDRCAAVIGGVLVYRDTNHLTATYAATLAPRLNAALERALRN